MADQINDEIDFIALLKSLLKKKKLILKLTLIGGLIGLIVGLLTPKTYTSSVTFILQQSDGKQLNSSLGGLASLAGINLNSGSNSSIAPVIYPEILKSYPFKKSLISKEVFVDGESLTYKEYNLNKPIGVLSFIKKYTIGLPSLIIKSFKSTDEQIATLNNTIETVSDEDFEIYKNLDNIINISINDKDGNIDLSVTESSPELSAQLTQFATKILQDKIIELQIEKTKENYLFIEAQYNLKKEEFNKAQDSLAFFKEQNLNINSAFVENTLDRLQSHYNLTNSVYTELAKQLEQAKIEVNKNTPIFTVIDPVSVPKEKAGPKKALIIVIYTFLFFVLAVGYILLLDPIKSILKEINP